MNVSSKPHTVYCEKLLADLGRGAKKHTGAENYKAKICFVFHQLMQERTF